MIPTTRELLPGAPARAGAGSKACAAAGGAGVLTGAVLVGIALAAGPGLGAPGYVSEAGTAGSALTPAYRAGMLVLAAGLLALGTSVRRLSLVATGLLTAAAAAAAVSGTVPCTPGCPLPPYQETTVADVVHAAASIAGLAAVALAMLWLAVLPTTPAGLRWAAGAGAALTVPLGLLEAATMLVVGRGAVAGAVERVLLCVVVAWLAALAWVRYRAPEFDEIT
jgi:hypothetical protein